MDELATKLADVFECKAFAELLKVIFQMVQEIPVMPVKFTVFLEWDGRRFGGSEGKTSLPGWLSQNFGQNQFLSVSPKNF